VTWEGRIVFEVSSAEPDAEVPVWVDLSSRILDDLQAVRLQIGRQNDLDQSEPARLELLLNNADDALTYANTLSPYAAWWGPGRKCRLRDTVSGALLTLFTGYIEVSTEAVITTGIEARVTISAVDRLGRLGDAPKFISTLAAHIAYVGGTELAYFWPLGGDGALNFPPAVGSDPPLRGQLDHGISLATYLSPGGGDPIPGDDLNPALFTVTYAGGAPDGRASLRADFPSPIVLKTGDTVSVAVWARPSAVDDNNPLATVILLQGGPELTPVDEIVIGADVPASGKQWISSFALNSSAWGSNVNVSTVGYDTWHLVTAQLTLGQPGQVWVNGTQGTGTSVGVIPSTVTFSRLTLAVDYPGSLAYAQVYVARSTAIPFAFARHREQWQMGLLGLDRQSTGDRVRTIAQYAGLPNVEVANTIDAGASLMRRAELAGKDPLTAMREAETTEQGLLSTDADGRLVFRDRRTLYNI